MEVYKPRPSDIAWTEDLISMCNDGALWGSSYGKVRVDKANKKMTYLNSEECLSLQLANMSKKTFLYRLRLNLEQIGWELIVSPKK